MPIIYKRHIEDLALAGIWNIQESTGELLHLIKLNDTEKQIFATFRTEPRMKQWLAWRALLAELMKPHRHHVEYDESGKPYLAGSNHYISVTHTEHLAAVILSNYIKVGIDIERIRPRIEKVKDKYMNETELAHINPVRALEQLTLGWCAKEALYKLYGMRNLDFRENIRIEIPERADCDNFIGKIILPLYSRDYQLVMESIDDFVIVYALDNQ